MNYEKEYNKLFEYFSNQIQDKRTIKTSHEYNAYSDSDYSFENLNAIYNELFILKVFMPEKYLEIINSKKSNSNE